MKRNTAMTTNRKEQNEKGFLYGTQIRLVHVVFGMPSLNCSRYGLCRIEDRWDVPLDDADIRRQPNTALAYMCLHPKGISFTFLSDTLSEKDSTKFFGNDHFLIAEDKPLSKRLAAHFGIEAATILRGAYGIKKGTKSHTIHAKMLLITQRKTNEVTRSEGLKVA